MRRVRATQKYPPLVAMAVSILLVIAVLPSALNLPQSNPSTTLEYAPVPPSEEDSTPPGGNISALGLAKTSSLTDEAPAGPKNAPTLGANPSTKRCVGSPPRQTEDPLAPPCVAYFQGNNFGATYKGVTAREIKIVYYHECCIYNTSGTGAEQPRDGEFWDLAEPIPPNKDHFAARVLQAFQRYFNNRFQTYNRFVHFYLGFSHQEALEATPETRRADAAAHYRRVKPFAVMSYTTGGSEQSYLEFMARNGVLNFSSDQGRDAAFFNRFPARIWGYPPSIEIMAKQYSSYVCRKVVPHKVSFSGSAGDNGKPRRLGLLWANNAQLPNFRTFRNLAKRAIERCGGTFVAEASFESVRNAVTNAGYDVAAANMAYFRQRGVTTVIWPQGYETLHSKAGAQIGYRPEWVVAGDRAHDGNGAAGFQDQSAWRHAVVTTNEILAPPVQETRCAQALREADPGINRTDVSTTCNLRNFYNELRQLFTGIQVAGPRLDPGTIDKGFHAIPSIASTDPTVPACFYDPGDYTCVKDAVGMWWDPDKTPPGGRVPGCWRMPEGGRRYLAGGWPRGDVLAHRSAKDPCTAFSGVYFA